MEPLIQKILVPVDFSEASERAAAYALALSRRLGASLHIVHVLEASFLGRATFDYEPDAPAFRERLYQEARAQLAELVTTLDPGPARISTEVRQGTAAESVTNAEAEYGADLVIMSTHGRTGLSHLLLGSVAEQVIRTARCPVLVIRDCGQVHVHRPHPAAVLQEA